MARISAEDEWIGHASNCPTCGGDLVVPMVESPPLIPLELNDSTADVSKPEKAASSRPTISTRLGEREVSRWHISIATVVALIAVIFLGKWILPDVKPDSRSERSISRSELSTDKNSRTMQSQKLGPIVDLQKDKQDIQQAFHKLFPHAIYSDLDKDYNEMSEMVDSMISGGSTLAGIYPEYRQELEELKNLRSKMVEYGRNKRH